MQIGNYVILSRDWGLQSATAFIESLESGGLKAPNQEQVAILRAFLLSDGRQMIAGQEALEAVHSFKSTAAFLRGTATDIGEAAKARAKVIGDRYQAIIDWLAAQAASWKASIEANAHARARALHNNAADADKRAAQAKKIADLF